MYESMRKIVQVRLTASKVWVQKPYWIKDRAKSVPAAAVIPMVQVIVDTGFKTFEVGLCYFISNLMKNMLRINYS
jgi:hypothetical protein